MGSSFQNPKTVFKNIENPILLGVFTFVKKSSLCEKNTSRNNSTPLTLFCMGDFFTYSAWGGLQKPTPMISATNGRNNMKFLQLLDNSLTNTLVNSVFRYVQYFADSPIFSRHRYSFRSPLL